MSFAGMNCMLCTTLLKLFKMNPDKFTPHINTLKDTEERYHPNRSWRRTSNTRDIDQWVNNKGIDIVYRWSDTETSKKGKVHLGNVSPLLSYGCLTIIVDKVCDSCRDPGTGVIRGVISELKVWVNYDQSSKLMSKLHPSLLFLHVIRRKTNV